MSVKLKQQCEQLEGDKKQVIRSLCEERNRSTWSQLGTANSNNGASKEKPLHCTQGEGDANRTWELVSFAWVGGRKNDGFVSDLTSNN
jgi:hypothetical protein